MYSIERYTDYCTVRYVRVRAVYLYDANMYSTVHYGILYDTNSYSTVQCRYTIYQRTRTVHVLACVPLLQLLSMVERTLSKMLLTILAIFIWLLAEPTGCLVVKEYKLTGGIDSGLLSGMVILERMSEKM